MKSKVTKTSFVLFIILIGIGLILANCGGGDGDDAESTAVIKKGKFLDSAVSGLEYSSGNQSGITD